MKPTRDGINAELFKLVSDPPEWVKPLRNPDPVYFLTKHKELVASFLSATTDSVRLVRASKVSRAILKEYDMEELEDLRATIQVSELMRVIPYAKQTDHSAHTLYLYLLGVYLFLACKPLRTQFAAFLREHDQAKLVERFLFQWVYVSLLHDIGYIFQGRSRSEIRAVDRMFRPSSISRLLNSEDAATRRGAVRAISQWPVEPFEPIQNPEDMLTRLRHIPWGLHAEFRTDIFESFETSVPRPRQIAGNDLEDYAYRVASSGYDGFSEGTVDHAVASGLFLFSYSTLWFALAKEVDFTGSFEKYRDNGFPRDDVLCACFSAAAHSIIGAHAEGLPALEFERNPFLYLGVLCDELQKWDRFPAGQKYLVDLDSFEKHCTDSERITLDGGWDGEKVIFRVEEGELAKSIQGALRRVASPERFVEINPAPPARPEAPAAGQRPDGTPADQQGTPAGPTGVALES